MLSFVKKCTFSSIKVIPICHPEHDWVYSYIAYGKDKSNAFLVDPGQSGKTLQYLRNNPELQISNILLTHHHILHSGNLPEFLQDLKALHPNKSPQIFIGEHDALKFQAFPFLPFTLIKKETSFEFNEIYLTCIPSPCHTVGSLMFQMENQEGWQNDNSMSLVQKDITECYRLVFTGDTHFIGGCGVFMEGIAKQMHVNLLRLMKMKRDTFLFPGHEYTVNNLRWAMGIEWENEAYEEKLKWAEERMEKGEPTVPSMVGEEFEINIFWRTKVKRIQEKMKSKDAIQILAMLREMKDKNISLKEKAASSLN